MEEPERIERLRQALGQNRTLRIVTAMYFRDTNQPFTPTRSSGLLFVIVLCPLLVLELGIMPGWWLRLIG